MTAAKCASVSMRNSCAAPVARCVVGQLVLEKLGWIAHGWHGASCRRFFRRDLQLPITPVHLLLGCSLIGFHPSFIRKRGSHRTDSSATAEELYCYFNDIRVRSSVPDPFPNRFMKQGRGLALGTKC
jgi:hypothetical protein